MPFPTLPSEERLEGEVADRWEAQDVPARALRHNAGAAAFIFYEGPPTANGRPALHHVFSRTLKDAVCRHRLMTGHHVPRKAGWDTQGLPVEIEVQKELGIQTRDEIEAIGIAEFNRRCRDSVFTYKTEWEKVSLRMGYWLDYEHPYVTCESDYIQSCWAILSRFHAAGLLKRDFKSLPFCPRCSTGLSNHEVAQGYETVQDPSIFVRFGVEAAALRERLADAATFEDGRGWDDVTAPALLVWTTTPWTLFSNLATAVDAGLTYVLAQPGGGGADAGPGEQLILAEARCAAVLGDDAQILARFPGAALAGADGAPGLAYSRPLDAIDVDAAGAPVWTIFAGDFVTADDGTGIVHIAPDFGSDDFRLGQEHGLPILQSVDDQGRFTDAVTGWEGRFVKEADKDVIRHLKETGRLLRQVTVDHSYPHCWRCRSPLLYMARPSWYILTTKLRDRMLALNDTIAWHPPEIGTGRFGEWLSNNVDWAISRERYWGTPLNVWICDDCGVERAPASLEELGLAADFDPHRPYIDDVTLSCIESGCSGTLRRTPEVIDCWFDSGAMPFAQAGWPRATGGELPALYPADFISEGLDQTRGWFYTLHVISAFLSGDVLGPENAQPATRRVLVNNMLLDGQGKKMSKSRGNVVDPWEIFERCGADATRWAFVSQGQVWLPKRIDEKTVNEGARRTFGTLRNCYAFLAMYANLDGWEPGDAAPAVADRPSIDRWLVSRLQTLTRTVGEAYETLDLVEAATQLDAFIDEELSNWYVRRNRARFWKSGDDADKRAAFATLSSAIERVAVLLAPLVPFQSEWLWRATTGAPADASVHLTDWPTASEADVDGHLERRMSVVLDAVGLGRSVRAAHDLRVRQPLARALVKAADPEEGRRLAEPEFARLVADELNVKAVEVVDVADFRVLSAKPDFKRLGPRLGKRMKALAGAVAALDEAALERFAAEGSLELTVDGEVHVLDRQDIQLVETGREGYAVAGDGRLVLALDTALDDDLLAEGRAREIVSRVQSTRKSAGLDVADRVEVALAGAPELLDAARRHEALILAEVLGVKLETLDGDGPAGASAYDVDGAELRVAVRRVEVAETGGV